MITAPIESWYIIMQRMSSPIWRDADEQRRAQLYREDLEFIHSAYVNQYHQSMSLCLQPAIVAQIISVISTFTAAEKHALGVVIEL